MNIKVYAISMVKDKNQLAAIKEYDKRLGRYCKIEMILVKNKEMLLKKLSNKSHVIKVSTEGDLITSEGLAEKIKTLGVTGTSDMAFVYSEEEFEWDEHVAISKMDMSLGMVMTILFEQIYRGYRIIHNQAYHK
ncbi:MAG: 23S rRNA (pseudouridine(1915)-N(3))-methyltransferase RlmH [Clostridiales bacterium]|nr:23S rRNA (pseudouridine(1915)-N(3))-methyltransferase RlmH [Clostridiales bacterium]